MEMNADVIENLLRTTGLSCDDLLAKLQQYRLKKNSETSPAASCSNSTSSQDKENTQSAKSDAKTVILETKSSPIASNKNEAADETECNNEKLLTNDKSVPENDDEENAGELDENNSIIQQPEVNTENEAFHKIDEDNCSATVNNQESDKTQEHTISSTNARLVESDVTNEREHINLCSSLNQSNDYDSDESFHLDFNLSDEEDWMETEKQVKDKKLNENGAPDQVSDETSSNSEKNEISITLVSEKLVKGQISDNEVVIQIEETSENEKKSNTETVLKEDVGESTRLEMKETKEKSGICTNIFNIKIGETTNCVTITDDSEEQECNAKKCLNEDVNVGENTRLQTNEETLEKSDTRMFNMEIEETTNCAIIAEDSEEQKSNAEECLNEDVNVGEITPLEIDCDQISNEIVNQKEEATENHEERKSSEVCVATEEIEEEPSECQANRDGSFDTTNLEILESYFSKKNTTDVNKDKDPQVPSTSKTEQDTNIFSQEFTKVFSDLSSTKSTKSVKKSRFDFLSSLCSRLENLSSEEDSQQDSESQDYKRKLIVVNDDNKNENITFRQKRKDADIAQQQGEKLEENIEEVKDLNTNEETAYSSQKLEEATLKELEDIEEQTKTDAATENAHRVDEESSPKSEENLRDTLRLQLSSLRSMKQTGLLPDLKTPSMTFQNLKKKRKSCDVNSRTSEDGDSKPEADNSNDNSIVSLSDQMPFVIADVSGGVDKLSEIDGSQQMRFAIISINRNIAQFSQDPGVDVSKKTEKSPFVSDSLEDFLSESAQLKVSYQIPKLGAEEGISENKRPIEFVETNPKVEASAEPKEKTRKSTKPKTLAEKRRQFEKQQRKELREKRKLRSAEVFKFNRNSYIFYDNRRILLSGRQVKCFGSILSKSNKAQDRNMVMPQKVAISPKKPTLLSALACKNRPKVTYKPGPLSQKCLLQDEASKQQWTTELKVLPKIHLEVWPEPHKPLEYAHLLPIFDDVVISQKRTDFALSVLKPKDCSVAPQPFTFHVPYNHKVEKMLVRKERLPPVRKLKFDDVDIQGDVGKILNDIITYLEIKEIEPTLVKEDEPLGSRSEPLAEKTKTKRTKTKLDNELRRLSCRVIDVATKDAKDCSLASCRLGCVCNSLLCESVFSNHCQLVDCMFGCKCSIPTNTLSVITVNQLEDKAKKDLAKVEKEFTQTFIHTDNDSMLVTSRAPRSSKPPKKYTDYISENLLDEPPRKRLKCKDCEVVLERMDLGGVVPFCMHHNCYDCHCRGESVPLPRRMKKEEEVVRAVRVKLPQEHRPRREEKLRKCHDSCARVRKVFEQYRERNKNPHYNHKLKKTYARGLLNSQRVSAVEDIGELDVAIVHEDELPKTNKRKQTLVVKEDLPEFAIQRRNKKVVLKSVHRPLFDGEIKVPLENNTDMLNLVGNTKSSDYLRILPWDKLIENFRAGKFLIWSRNTPSSLVLCNLAGHRTPGGYTDIRNVTRPSELVQWILTDQLPLQRPRQLMHVILRRRSNNFLIAGCCLKKLEEQTNGESGPKLQSILKPKEAADASSEVFTKLKERKLILVRTAAKSCESQEMASHYSDVDVLECSDSDNAIDRPKRKRISRCTHKDMHGISKTLVLTKQQFDARTLYYYDGNKELQIDVALPMAASTARWRMIHLHIDFSYMTLSPADYSIKYGDLMDVVHMATTVRSTVSLANTEFSRHYKHPLFAIYCVPNLQDRLFVGPFGPNEANNVDFHRLLKGKLVDVKVFNKLLGKGGENQAVWLFESNSKGDVVIDITEDEEVQEVVNLDSDSDESLSESDNDLLCPPFVTVLTPAELKGKFLANRFITTNIPNLGYLTAWQEEGCKEIEIFWPGKVKGYRFSNVNIAKNLLTHYFTQIFCPVSPDFKIIVIMLTKLDVQRNKVMDGKYFYGPGPYFCGEFGVCDKASVHFHIPETESVSSLRKHQKSQENTIRMIQIFGCFLMSNAELGHTKYTNDPISILDWAKSEVYVQEKLGAHFVSEKTELVAMKNANMQKLKKLRLEAAAASEQTETIEIPDSDEEEANRDEGPVFKKICIDTAAVFNDKERSVLKTKTGEMYQGETLILN